MFRLLTQHQSGLDDLCSRNIKRERTKGRFFVSRLVSWPGATLRRKILNTPVTSYARGPARRSVITSRVVSFEQGITEIGCMAHARRKFFDLHAANKSQLAEQALHLIGGRENRRATVVFLDQ